MSDRSRETSREEDNSDYEEGIVAGAPGVRGAYNLLVPVAIDSHIPDNATD